MVIHIMRKGEGDTGAPKVPAVQQQAADRAMEALGRESTAFKNPVVLANSIEDMKEAIREANPKYVVFLGKHEPFEPTNQIVNAKVDGMPLHEHYDKKDVLFVKLPESHTPYGFRKNHAAFLEELAGQIEKGEEKVSEDPRVNHAFADAVREVFSGKTDNLVEAFAERLVGISPGGELLPAGDEARNNALRLAMAQGIVPPTEEMVASQIGKELGRKIEIISLHYDTGFMSGINKFETGRNYEIAEVASSRTHGYMCLEFGRAEFQEEPVASNPEEKRRLAISAKWEDAPERLFPGCRDSEGNVQSQVGGGENGRYLQRSILAAEGKFEADARDLKGLLDQVIKA